MALCPKDRMSTTLTTLTSPPKNRVREYETIYILRSDVDPDTAEKLTARLSDVMDKGAGRLVKVENWGRRRLAYDIAKHKRGVYTYIKYLGGGALVAELERSLRLQDSVLRFQTVLVREDVVIEEVEINEEETKFERIEAAPEGEDANESRERELGLLDAPEERRSRRPDDFEQSYDDEESMNPELAETSEEKLPMSQRNIDFGDDKDLRTPDLNADAPGRRRGARKRVCKFCADKALGIDYKDPQALRYFVSERGKIVPRRISGNCALHQRKVQVAIKRARNVALMPFTISAG
jgi:small subunit ribosomal protein S6